MVTARGHAARRRVLNLVLLIIPMHSKEGGGEETALKS